MKTFAQHGEVAAAPADHRSMVALALERSLVLEVRPTRLPHDDIGHLDESAAFEWNAFQKG